jgi:hypothetical protein
LVAEDWAFVKRFLLASGSLKELARVYGVSYPTIRQRLDRLIEKLRLYDEGVEMSPFERLLRSLLADGRLGSEAFRAIEAAHREAVVGRGESALQTSGPEVRQSRTDDLGGSPIPARSIPATHIKANPSPARDDDACDFQPAI